MVDEAKAFCPGCGNAFVDEEIRQEASSFDTTERTVELGQSMYNQMLSDMGLNISKEPNPSEKRVEVALPPAKPTQIMADKPRPAANIKSFALGVLIILVFLLIVLGGVLFMFWRH
ncbi:MAG: hypothetical protein ABIO36_00700 [Pyrinomonadaceae bacterium]